MCRCLNDLGALLFHFIIFFSFHLPHLLYPFFFYCSVSQFFESIHCRFARISYYWNLIVFKLPNVSRMFSNSILFGSSFRNRFQCRSLHKRVMDNNFKQELIITRRGIRRPRHTASPASTAGDVLAFLQPLQRGTGTERQIKLNRIASDTDTIHTRIRHSFK